MLTEGNTTLEEKGKDVQSQHFPSCWFLLLTWAPSLGAALTETIPA